MATPASKTILDATHQSTVSWSGVNRDCRIVGARIWRTMKEKTILDATSDERRASSIDDDESLVLPLQFRSYRTSPLTFGHASIIFYEGNILEFVTSRSSQLTDNLGTHSAHGLDRSIIYSIEEP